MARRKRRHRSSGELEAEALRGRWSGLREQAASEAIHHTEDDNRHARELTDQLLAGTLDLDQYLSWGDLFGNR